MQWAQACSRPPSPAHLREGFRAVRGDEPGPPDPAVGVRADRDPRPDGRSQAGWVSEGAIKPASQVGVGVKTMTGKKVALLVPVSNEVVMTNPGGVLDQLSGRPAHRHRARLRPGVHQRQGLPDRFRRPLPEYLAQTPNSVALGTAAASAGGCTSTWSTAWARSSTRTSTSPASRLTRGSRWTRCSRSTPRASAVRGQLELAPRPSTASTGAPSPASTRRPTPRASRGSTGAG
jgi:hypothetical protein